MLLDGNPGRPDNFGSVIMTMVYEGQVVCRPDYRTDGDGSGIHYGVPLRLSRVWMAFLRPGDPTPVAVGCPSTRWYSADQVLTGYDAQLFSDSASAIGGDSEAILKRAARILSCALFNRRIQRRSLPGNRTLTGNRKCRVPRSGWWDSASHRARSTSSRSRGARQLGLAGRPIARALPAPVFAPFREQRSTTECNRRDVGPVESTTIRCSLLQAAGDGRLLNPLGG
jgi:hypothetical protein